MIPMPVALALAAAAALMFAGLAVAAAFPVIKDAWARMGGHKGARWVFIAAVAGATMFGGAKHTGSVTYPFTDVEQRYLVDHGSRVDNDSLHVDFVRMVAPASAPLIIDYRPISSTNVEDWVSLVVTTFADFPVPQDVAIEAATNYNFIVYTTWTPPPAVHTNGIMELIWQQDPQGRGFAVPMRTSIYVDDEKISPPELIEPEEETP